MTAGCTAAVKPRRWTLACEREPGSTQTTARSQPRRALRRVGPEQRALDAVTTEGRAAYRRRTAGRCHRPRAPTRHRPASRAVTRRNDEPQDPGKLPHGAFEDAVVVVLRRCVAPVDGLGRREARDRDARPLLVVPARRPSMSAGSGSVRVGSRQVAAEHHLDALQASSRGVSSRRIDAKSPSVAISQPGCHRSAQRRARPDRCRSSVSGSAMPTPMTLVIGAPGPQYTAAPP